MLSPHGWPYHMKKRLVEMVHWMKTINENKSGEKGETTARKSLLSSVQNADCFGEEINLYWLRGNQFVDNTGLGKFCCISNFLTWVVTIKQNFILFTCTPDGRKCKQLSKRWWSLFFHILACHYVRDLLFQQIETSKPSNQILPPSLSLYSNYHQLLTFRNSFPKMKLWWVCMVIIIFTLISTI